MPAIANLLYSLRLTLTNEDYSSGCHCNSCRTLRPIATALARYHEEKAQEDLRVFCESAQAPQRPEESAGQVAEGDSSLAEAEFLISGYIVLHLNGRAVKTFTTRHEFAEYCRRHKLKVHLKF